MTVRLYFDVHVPRSVTQGLRLRGIDVLTAQEDEAAQLVDSALLTRATERGRLLFSQDEDLPKRHGDNGKENRSPESCMRHQLNVSIGAIISDLELIAGATDPEEWVGTVVFLPLK